MNSNILCWSHVRKSKTVCYCPIHPSRGELEKGFSWDFCMWQNREVVDPLYTSIHLWHSKICVVFQFLISASMIAVCLKHSAYLHPWKWKDLLIQLASYNYCYMSPAPWLNTSLKLLWGLFFLLKTKTSPGNRIRHISTSSEKLGKLCVIKSILMFFYCFFTPLSEKTVLKAQTLITMRTCLFLEALLLPSGAHLQTTCKSNFYLDIWI